MTDSLRNTLLCSGGSPAWKNPNLRVCLTSYIHAEFRKLSPNLNIADIIAAAKRRSSSSPSSSPSSISAAIDYDRLETDACHVIFGSNLIENAGADLPSTITICRAVFRGELINNDDNDGIKGQEDPATQQQQQQPEIYPLSHREVIQHAQALAWAIINIVCAGQPWTENAVKTVHAILYAGLEDDDNHEGVFPGEYRDINHAVAARYVDRATGKAKVTRFVHPRAVRTCMAAWAAGVSADVSRAESYNAHTGEIDRIADPYDLAARYYHRFINIHPFGDGNGRTSRVILNCLVLQFAGHLVPLGVDEGEKTEFLDVAVSGARSYYEEEGVVDFEEQMGHCEVARLMVRKSVMPIERMGA